MKVHCGSCGILREVKWFLSLHNDYVQLGLIDYNRELERKPEPVVYFCTVECLLRKVNAWAIVEAEKLRKS